MILLSPGAARGQTEQVQDPERPSLLANLAKGLVTDPTTYAPSVLLYESMHLDWVSSQPFFHNGFIEGNPRYTVTGLPHDVPIGYGEGNRRILRDALANLPMALSHNAANRMIERMLIDRYPNHPGLIRSLGWIERLSFASYMSYRLSADHFRQWRANDRLAGQYGYH